ncbi:MAG: glycosyltransferase family 39 protein [archaeon]
MGTRFPRIFKIAAVAAVIGLLVFLNALGNADQSEQRGENFFSIKTHQTWGLLAAFGLACFLVGAAIVLTELVWKFLFVMFQFLRAPKSNWFFVISGFALFAASGAAMWLFGGTKPSSPEVSKYLGLANFLALLVPALALFRGTGAFKGKGSWGKSTFWKCFALGSVILVAFGISFIGSSQKQFAVDSFIARNFFDQNSCGQAAIRGSDGRIGPIWPLFFGLSNLIFGGMPNAQAISFSIVATLCIFLVYLVSKELFSEKSALIIAAIVPWTELGPITPSVNELGLQAFISLLFFYLLIRELRKPGKNSPVLLGLVAGIGIANKIFFLAFLAGIFLATTISGNLGKLKRLGLTKGLVRGGLSLLIGAYSLLSYNLSSHFGSVSIAAGIKFRYFWIGVLERFSQFEIFSSTEDGRFKVLLTLVFISTIALFFSRKKTEVFLPMLSFVLLIPLSALTYSSLDSRHIYAFFPLLFISIAGLICFLEERKLLGLLVVLAFLLPAKLGPVLTKVPLEARYPVNSSEFIRLAMEENASAVYFFDCYSVAFDLPLLEEKVKTVEFFSPPDKVLQEKRILVVASTYLPVFLMAPRSEREVLERISVFEKAGFRIKKLDSATYLYEIYLAEGPAEGSSVARSGISGLAETPDNSSAATSRN